MFGFGEDKNAATPPPIGAKAKLEYAKKFRHSRPGGVTLDPQSGKTADATVPVVIAFGLSVTLAFFLTLGVLSEGISFRLPYVSGEINRLFLGASPPTLYNDPDVNRLIIVFIRGFAIFFAAGLVPICARTWNTLFDRRHANIYVSCWVMSVGLPFAYILVHDFIMPLIFQ